MGIFNPFMLEFMTILAGFMCVSFSDGFWRRETVKGHSQLRLIKIQTKLRINENKYMSLSVCFDKTFPYCMTKGFESSTWGL